MRSWLLLSAAALAAAQTTLFANTPVQLVTDDPTDYFFGFDPNVPLDKDSDVVAFHDDFYGVPWQSFMSGTPNITNMPLSWLIRVNNTLNMIEHWQKPVFLGLEMLSGTLRTCPAQNASDGGPTGAIVDAFTGCSQCYDFNPQSNPEAAAVILAYAFYASFYVQLIVERLQQVSIATGLNLPLVAVNFAAEINLGQRLCGDAWWSDVVAFSNTVYGILKPQLAKIGSASTLLFPSLQMEVIMGLQTGPDQPCVGMTGGKKPSAQIIQCIKDGLATVAPLQRDAFGVSTYPANAQAGLPDQKPHWQPWYLTAVLQQLSKKDRASFIVAETGYLADDLVVNLANGTVGAVPSVHGRGRGVVSRPVAQQQLADPPVQCAVVLNTSVADTNAWLSYLISTAASEAKAGYDWPLLVWWSNTDLLWPSSISSCPCTVPQPWESSCTFISAYRSIFIAEGQPAFGGELDAKAFGTMGIRQVDGTPKDPIWDTWQTARKQAAAQRAAKGER